MTPTRVDGAGVASFVTPFSVACRHGHDCPHSDQYQKRRHHRSRSRHELRLALLVVILVAAPLAAHIPAGDGGDFDVCRLEYGRVAWVDAVHQYRLPYRVTLLAVFVLTVVFDLTVAVEVGLVAACVTFVTASQLKPLRAGAATTLPRSPMASRYRL